MTLVRTDQCMYGLRLPHACVPCGGMHIRKLTRFLGNIVGLSNLHRICNKTHKHVWALGSVKLGSKSISVAKTAGHYLSELCKHLGGLFSEGIAQLRGSID